MKVTPKARKTMRMQDKFCCLITLTALCGVTAPVVHAASPDSMIESDKIKGLAPTQVFQPYGGVGDASFDDRCPAGQYLVGLRVRSGLWLDQMAISCAPINADGTLGGRYYGPARGGNGGGPGEGYCPPGQVINNMNFTLTNGNRQVIKFDFHCRSTTNAAAASLLTVGSPAINSNIAPHPPGQSCPGGDAATGMTGRTGQHVNAVGLVCSRIVVPQAPAQASNKPPRRLVVTKRTARAAVLEPRRTLAGLGTR